MSQDLCAQQESNIPTKLQFCRVQLSLNQTKIAKENKGLFLVGGLARLQRKKTKSQYENVIVGALKTRIWVSTGVFSPLVNLSNSFTTKSFTCPNGSLQGGHVQEGRRSTSLVSQHPTLQQHPPKSQNVF